MRHGRGEKKNGLGTRKNGALQEDVQKKISESVKRLWDEGAYKDRINGMTGKTKGKHPQWKWGKHNYRKILFQHEVKECRFCWENNQKLDVHHIDENRNNYLLSNLIWACVPCHLYYHHYNTRHKQPWIKRSKKFRFEYTKHMRRGRLRGYLGKLKVTIKARINPEEFVDDFYDVSALVETAVVKNLDHSCLNDHLKNPTSKNLLVWIWRRLERAGLKGLRKIEFSKNNSCSTVLTARDMRETYGWDFINDRWKLIRKPIATRKGRVGKKKGVK